MVKLLEVTAQTVQNIAYDDLVTLHRGAHRVIKLAVNPAEIKQAHDYIAQRLCEIEGTSDHGTPLDITKLALSTKLYDNSMQMAQTGLYLKSPHGTLIYNGKKSIIAQGAQNDALLGEHIIVSKEDGKGLAFGEATIDQPIVVSHGKFNDYFEQHRVTIAECEKWWKDCESLYLYPIIEFKPYVQPVEVEVPAGVQLIMERVEFKQKVQEDAMPWTASDAERHTRAANTPKKREQWASVANSALQRCLDDGGEKDQCEASAIRQANSVVAKSENNKAAEPGQITCTCPNCGEVAEHEPGTPCREIPCPKCGAMMRGTTIDDADKAASIPFAEQADTVEANNVETIVPKDSLDILAQMVANRLREDHFAFLRPQPEQAAPVKPAPVTELVTAGPVAAEPAAEPVTEPIAEPAEPEPADDKSLLTRIKSAIQHLFHLAPSPEIMPSFKVFHNKATNQDWLVLWTTNSYQDREEETFTIASIKDYVNRYADEPIKGEFWYAHTPGTKFGTILWQSDVADRFLVQMGPFDDTPIGNTFKEFFSKHPDGHPVIAPVGWGASHGFNYIASDREDKVYDWFNTVESSVLPRHRAANIHNPSPIFTGGKDMQDKSRAELQAIGEELGVNLLEMIEATAQQRKSELDDIVVHKEIETTESDTRATWDTAYVNDLPDSAFLYVEPGDKDEDGKTVPRSKRHFPVKDADGSYDVAHVRNAIARIPQSNAPGLSAEKKASLQKKAQSILASLNKKKVAESATSEPASATDIELVVSAPEPQPAPQFDQEQFVKTVVEQVASSLITKVSETFGMESLSETISSLRDGLQQTQAVLDKQQSSLSELTEQLAELKRSDEDRLAEKEARLPKYGPNIFSWQRPSQSETTVLSPNDQLAKSAPTYSKVPEAVARLSEQR